MKKRRLLSLMMAIVLLISGTNWIVQAMDSVYFDNQPLKQKSNAAVEPLLRYSGEAETVNFGSTMVVWEHPETQEEYYGYCVNPKYGGWKPSAQYTVSVGRFDGSCVVDAGGSGGSGKPADGSAVGSSYTIMQSLEGAIVAGYPSRTAEEILGNNAAYFGVSQDELEYAAYIATKMAIWVVIHDAYGDTSLWNGYETSHYPQALADAALDGLKDIVNAARYYTPQPESDITLTAGTPFKNEATGNYEITYTIGGNPLPDTPIQILLEGNAPFLPGEKILVNEVEYPPVPGYNRVLVPADTREFTVILPIPADEEYSITRNYMIYAKNGRKLLLFAEAEVDAKQSYVMAGNASADPKASFTIGDSTVIIETVGDWIIYKLDAKTGEPLSGVTFDVYDSDGKLVDSGTTGTDGIYVPSVNKITGTYTVIERSTNPDYQLTEPTAQVVYVDFSKEQATHTYFRDFKKKDITVYKEDAITGESIKGCEYQIMQIDGKGAWQAVAETDAQGRIVWSDVPDGTYLVKEVSTVSGYILDDTPQYVTVRNGMAPSLKFLDSKYPGLTITKVDTQTGETITSPATFHVEQIDGTYSEYVTTSGGKVNLKDLPVGSYRITEVTAPAGYVIDNTPGTVYLGAGESRQYIANNLKKPVLVIEKIDAQTNTAIEGARFEIRKDTVLIGTVVTGKNGQVTVGLENGDLGYLEPGTYSVTEVYVPEPYVLPTDGSQHQDVVLNAGDTKTLFFTDLEKPKIVIEKYVRP